jgi:hypothetical protein
VLLADRYDRANLSSWWNSTSGNMRAIEGVVNETHLYDLVRGTLAEQWSRPRVGLGGRADGRVAAGPKLPLFLPVICLDNALRLRDPLITVTYGRDEAGA